MPLGIGYVLSVIEQCGIDVDFWDTYRPEYPKEYYFNRLKNGDYFACATGGFVYNIRFFVEIVKACKQVAPDVPFVLGGNITRNMKDELLFEYVNPDYLYHGEVEASFAEMLAYLAVGAPRLSDISGVSYLDPEGRIVKSPQKRVDLNSRFIMPNYELVDVPYYINSFKHHIYHTLGPTMFMLTGRGCTGGCSFCSPTVGKFQPNPTENTLNELDRHVSNYDFDAIGFITEIFFHTDEQIEEFCNGYIQAGYNKPWFSMIHPRISPSVFKKMREAGCIGVNMGLESGSDNILSHLKIGCTTDGFRRQLEAAREQGIAVETSFMIGNEAETKEDVRRSFDFLMEHKIQANFSMVSAYPGTSIYNKAKKRGLIEDEKEYLFSVLSPRYWKVSNIAEFPYLNISDIPDEDFFPMLVSESRRYFTWMYHEFQASDQLLSLTRVAATGESKRLPSVVKLKGRCKKCGTTVSAEREVGPAMGVLEIWDVCGNCFTRNYFDFLSWRSVADHFHNLCKRIQQAEKILIIGRGKNADDLVFLDILGLDYNKVIGFLDLREVEVNEPPTGLDSTIITSGQVIEEQPLHSERSLFYNFPRYFKQDSPELDYDIAIVTDDPLVVVKEQVKTVKASKLCTLIPWERQDGNHHDGATLLSSLGRSVVSRVAKLKQAAFPRFEIR